MRVFSNKIILLVITTSLIFYSYIFYRPTSSCEKIKLRFIAEQQQLELAVAGLLKQCDLLRKNNSYLPQFKSNFLKCRKIFKRIEFISEYYAPYLDINKPFLPEINEKDHEAEPPQGFSVIENMIYAQDSLPSLEELKHEIHLLQVNIQALKTIEKMPDMVNDGHMFEAMRSEITRITTLGITGYDTPETKTCIEESGVALAGVLDAVREYYPKMGKTLCEKLDSKFKEAILFLEENNGFDNFNRLKFIIDYANPLSIYLLEAQHKLNIPIYPYTKKTFLNYNAATIFDKTTFEKYYLFKDGKDSAATVELGKMLFFDPVLSGNSKRACASCHNPDKTFTDGLTKSIAFNFNGTLERNAPTILNASLQTIFFHDGRALTLEDQAGQVIQNPNELGGDLKKIVGLLDKSKEYQELFKKAFGKSDTLITPYKIKKSIAEFEKSLLALNSDFDLYIAGNKSKLSEAQVKGFNLFMGKAQCATCHFAPLFSGLLPPYYKKNETEVLGTTTTNNFSVPELDQDIGRSVITHIELQHHAFKTPSIRNASLTAPYMHNGSLKNLEEVMEFYNKGGGAGLGLEVPNQTLPSANLNLTKEEVNNIIAFINALSDTSNIIKMPSHLPKISNLKRKPGGEY